MNENQVEHKRDIDSQAVYTHRRRTDTGIRGWFNRNLPLIGYVILVAAIIFSIASVRNEGKDRRIDLAANARSVVLDGCKRDNETRSTLRDMILDGVETSLRFEREGLFTHVQAQRSIADTRTAAAKLPPIDCEAQARKITQGGA